MTDDLKQKETEAWEIARRDGPYFLGEVVHAAVSASIAAALREFYRQEIEPVKACIGNMQPHIAEALAPVLERVARLEGETACTRHGQYRCPACAAGMVEEAPATTQGIPQSGPQAPERVWIRRGNSSGLEWALIWYEAIGPLQKDYTEYVRADLLASAERRIAELVHSIAFLKAEGERRGREAGIREAAKEAAPYRDEILELLAKKPEVGT